mmetsp:Transcript_16407/g.21768  ORF Transcript_16407/g.21768 Transcript_16407/m.21768 type:complete len:204 (-) Transcript_16407:542-1153(-)
MRATDTTATGGGSSFPSFFIFSSIFTRDCADLDFVPALNLSINFCKLAASSRFFSYSACADNARNSFSSRYLLYVQDLYSIKVPAVISAILFTLASINPTSWETRTTLPSYFATYFPNQSLAALSKWFEGSSNSNRDGLLRSNLARAILICHPPEKSEHNLSLSSGSNPKPLRTLSTICSCSYPPITSNFSWASASLSSASSE